MQATNRVDVPRHLAREWRVLLDELSEPLVFLQILALGSLSEAASDLAIRGVWVP